MTASLRHAWDNGRAWWRRDPDLIQAERTPWQVIHQHQCVTLRYYPPLAERHIDVDGIQVAVAEQPLPVPLVLVAPLAVNMRLYDLFPHRSLVRYLRARGFELYLIDWGRPGSAENHWHFDTYLSELMPEMLAAVRAHSGQQQLSLHGWSFGAMFSLAYAALSGDPDLRGLALLGAPCDYHANGPLGQHYQRLSRTLRWLQQRTGWHIHRAPRRLLRSPGWANALAFKLTAPVATAQSYLELLRNLSDREFVSTHATNAAFLDDMVAYPGGIMQDVVRYLWTDNVMAAGRMPVRGEPERLSKVRTPLLLVIGRDDVIITRDCTLPIRDRVGSDDVEVLEVPGGHMGILGGSSAPQQIWPAVADWLAAHSQLPEQVVPASNQVV
ncbi:alpha/beta fold hydrolase [Isoalcanivorax beigongshangi]|uniref:Alpha/beta fold hydrolase n=1 Tax=Isoalcanivorax beigongshangi TaxID=3238810 RepID=A0ABV4AJL0_9GAMM